MKDLEPAIPQLPSGNINKTEDFFIQMLRFETTFKSLEYKILILKRGHCEIHFWQTSEEEALNLGRNSSCYIRTSLVDELFSEFKERGVVFRYELVDQPWGMREMQIDDPYGNAIRFGRSVSL